MNYIPTKVFSIPVDKNKVLASGLVNKADSGLVVNAIEWRIDKPYLMKNQLMVLDLLAHNDWKRPIYFAVTTGQDAYLGLEEFFQLEGLAYRLVPIKTPQGRNPNILGRIATNTMYNNVMTKFGWGGMDKEDIYMDENNLRMTTNLRLQFANLAEALINEGRNAEAKKVLDKTIAVMPEKIVPYDRLMVPVIESYYEIGELKTANELAAKLFGIYEKDMKYYLSLSQDFWQKQQNEVNLSMAVMSRLSQVAQFKQQAKLAKDMETRLSALQKQATMKMQAAPAGSPIKF